ncbi:MAG: rRNA maturation RNase YbeY [Lachnospiraceae bacterium]
MTVYIENESDIALPFAIEPLITEVVEAVLAAEKFPLAAEVEVLLTTQEAVQETNKEFRGIDRTTDVLSFPMIEFDKPAEYDILLSNPAAYKNPDTQEITLGDIQISVPHVVRQAEEYGHSLRRELAFLVAHSMLHLLGYDHMTETEAQDMQDRQEAVLEGLAIYRER